MGPKENQDSREVSMDELQALAGYWDGFPKIREVSK